MCVLYHLSGEDFSFQTHSQKSKVALLSPAPLSGKEPLL